MAEFQEVVEEAKRMCWHYTQKESHDGCPMYPACNVSQCRKIAFERPAEFEGRVMQWAADHPEPQFPMWWEWLFSIGAVTRKVQPDVAAMLIDTGLLDPIPADIAEKLGIEPKEG